MARAIPSGKKSASDSRSSKTDVRRYWRGDAGTTGALAWRLCGSADLYQRSGKEPLNSINFVTCHDGSEGPTADRTVEEVRIRQIKNMLATLLLSRGVPMLLGGDEFRRTQLGNNNAYCQDNEVSWYDWRLLDRNHKVFRFVRELIALRKRNPVLSADAFFAERDIEWFGPFGQPPDWDGPTRALGCFIRSQPQGGGHCLGTGLCLLFNASAAPIEFRLPAAELTRWRVRVDTGNAAPDDIFPVCKAPRVPDNRTYNLGSRALAVLSAE